MLKKLPAKSVRKTVASLALISKDKEISDRPLVSISLSSGQTHLGFIIDYTEGELLLCLADGNDRPSDNLCYLSTPAIASLTLHQSTQWSAQLSDGKVDPLDLRPKPGALEIKRKCVNTAEKLSTLLDNHIDLDVHWETLPKDEKSPKALDQFLDDLVNALTKLATDPETSRVITSKFKVIRIAHGDSKILAIDNSSLTVEFPTNTSSSDRFSESELYEQINKQF